MNAAGGQDRILRFRKAEIFLHWSIALPFLICFLSAAVLLLVYNPDPQRPYREVFSLLHRGSGVAMLTLPPLVLLFSRRSWGLFWSNIKEGLHFGASDLKWLFLMPLSALGAKVNLPESGKFNSGEKLNFMMVTYTYPFFTATGLVLLLMKSAILAWFVHLGLAIVATPLMWGHIYMATLNPSTKIGLTGMITGWVDRHWAQHHYARWFRENFGTHEPKMTPPPPPGHAVGKPVIVDIHAAAFLLTRGHRVEKVIRSNASTQFQIRFRKDLNQDVLLYRRGVAPIDQKAQEAAFKQLLAAIRRAA